VGRSYFGLTQSRQFAGAHPELTAFNLVLVLVEWARRRARRVPAVGVKYAAVAWAHEELGFREPSDRASEMSAIDGEDLERISGQTAHPAWDSCGLAIPGLSVGVYILAQPGLVFGIVSQITE